MRCLHWMNIYTTHLNFKLKEPDNVIEERKGKDDDDKEQAMTL